MSEKHVSILENAKKYLLREEFTCHAIKKHCEDDLGIDWELDYPDYIDTSKECHDILMEIYYSIEPFGAVDAWLFAKGIRLSCEEMYQYRLAWIDQMIEYWRDKK